MLVFVQGFEIFLPLDCYAKNVAKNLCLKGSCTANADFRRAIDWKNAVVPCVEKKQTNKKLCGRICGLKNDYSMTFAFNPERDDLFVCVVQKYFSFCFNRLF